MLNSDHNKALVISNFPLLNTDGNFKITSQQNPNYNCIAWAGNRSDRYRWPLNDAIRDLDGIIIAEWPFESTDDISLKTFIRAFYKLGYCSESKDHFYEEGYIKIALYVNLQDYNDPLIKLEDKKCTHAARQLLCELWTSKLGPWFDINHSTPYDIKGMAYGKVAIILKKEFK